MKDNKREELMEKNNLRELIEKDNENLKELEKEFMKRKNIIIIRRNNNRKAFNDLLTAIEESPKVVNRS